jgi:hypothetical protein
MLRERKIGGVWVLLWDEVMMRIALRWSSDILDILDGEVIPRMLGQYNR